MKCSSCGRSDLTLVTCVDASTMKMKRICPVCIQKGHPSERKKQPTLAELDASIAEYEIVALKAESFIKDFPEMPDLPPALAQIAFTPMSHYKALQAVLAELKSQRMEVLTNMESQSRLQYELKKSLAAEDYKQSAIIRDKIAEQNSKS